MSATLPLHHDPLLDDADARCERLDSDGERLFTPIDDINIDVLDAGLERELRANPDTRGFLFLTSAGF